MLTQNEVETIDDAIKSICNSADRLMFSRDTQTLGSGAIYVKLEDVLNNLQIIIDTLKESKNG